ncbi:hypothetical protein K438DRAFT_1934377 [Mycena galopus ATCC 62051]|nr:hypothetical protein K438DRAFT_1934377 [Mycena galopus ATCC 62051]
MAEYDGPLGYVLISSWFAAILYGVAICKTWEYVANPSRANVGIRKALLLCCMVSCSVGMVGQFAGAYIPTVTFWANTDAIQRWYWPSPVYLMGTCCTGIMVNGCLIHRLHRLTRSIWLVLFLGCWVVTGLAGSILVSIILMKAKGDSPRTQAATSALVWTVGTAGADISIAIALVWKLCTVTVQSQVKTNNSLIYRLIIAAIQTGTTTSTVAIAMMVSYYIVKDGSNAPTAFFYLIDPLYVLTLLYNLNLRPQGDTSTSEPTGPPTDHSLTDEFCMDEIRVHRSTVLSMDSAAGNTRTGLGHTSRSLAQTKPQEDSDVSETASDVI